MTHSESGRCAKRVIYTGRVQGVGFRMTTAEIARLHPVAGFVRNLADGSVELVASGTSAAVREFLDAVARRFQSNLHGCDEQDFAGDESFSRFEIRR